MTLYSFKGERPTQLPNRIKLSNGFTKTDNTTFTVEELKDSGWIAVEDPPVVQYPSKLEWNGEWYTRPPNEGETQFKWQEIRNECQRKLTETDYRVIKAVEMGNPIDARYITYRQALRDLYNNVNNVDPWTVEYPTLQFDEEA